MVLIRNTQIDEKTLAETCGGTKCTRIDGANACYDETKADHEGRCVQEK